MRRVSRFSTVVTSRISKVGVAVATLMTAAVVAFGGLSTVGAQATGTYQCGTYGGGNYNETDCTDPAPSTSTSTGGSTTNSSTSSSTSSNSSTSKSTTSTGSSSSSTSSTATKTPTATNVVLNDYTEYSATTGKSLGVKQGQVINFNLKGEKHTITVKSISANSLILTVASTPTDVTVGLAQVVSYDVDKDGTPDIEFTYKEYAATDSSASAIFRSVATTSETPVTSTSTGTSTGNSAGGITETPTSSTNLWWIWIIPIVIGIGLLIGVVVIVKKRRAAANNGNVGGSNFQF